MPDGQMLEFTRVTKRFNDVAAVSDFSARVEPGVVTAFLGPNGAGKTTSLRILLGQVRPTSGTATIGGVAYSDLRHPLRTIGSVLEETVYRPRRTATRQLTIAAKANGIPLSRVDEVLALVGLESESEGRIGSFSLGMRQRLSVANALLGDPGALVFDEPANGLDPEGIRWMRLLMRRLADEGRTVLVSSHVLSEVEQVADTVLMLSKGRLVLSSDIEKLADPSAGSVVVDAADRAALRAALDAAGFEVEVLRSGLTVRGGNAGTVGAVAASAGIALSTLVQRGPTLEDVFIELVRGGKLEPRAQVAASQLASPEYAGSTAPADAAPAAVVAGVALGDVAGAGVAVPALAVPAFAVPALAVPAFAQDEADPELSDEDVAAEDAAADAEDAAAAAEDAAVEAEDAEAYAQDAAVDAQEDAAADAAADAEDAVADAEDAAADIEHAEAELGYAGDASDATVAEDAADAEEAAAEAAVAASVAASVAAGASAGAGGAEGSGVEGSADAPRRSFDEILFGTAPVATVDNLSDSDEHAAGNAHDQHSGVEIFAPLDSSDEVAAEGSSEESRSPWARSEDESGEAPSESGEAQSESGEAVNEDDSSSEQDPRSGAVSSMLAAAARAYYVDEPKDYPLGDAGFGASDHGTDVSADDTERGAEDQGPTDSGETTDAGHEGEHHAGEHHEHHAGEHHEGEHQEHAEGGHQGDEHHDGHQNHEHHDGEHHEHHEGEHHNGEHHDGEHHEGEHHEHHEGGDHHHY